MLRNHALYLALTLALPAASVAAPAAPQMPSAPVTEAPSAGAMGAADFAATALTAPRVVGLTAPTRTEVATLASRRVQQDKNAMPFEIGLNRSVARSRIDLNALPWQTLGDGAAAARFELASEGAAALRAQLVLRGAGAAKATLRFAGDDGRVFELSGAQLAGASGWSPVVSGDTLTVELTLPKGVARKSLSLNAPRISHLDLSPAASLPAIRAKIGESQSCERDVACRVGAPAGYASATKSVARMTYTTSQGTYLCTGTLLNNAHSPKKRLFWTAAHCISDQSVANTLQTYWFYETTACGGSTVSPAYTTLSGGAFLRHANASRDTALLELKTAPPAGAFYAGWSSAPIASTGVAIEGIHHPAGDVKKISLGKVTGLNASALGVSKLYRVVWDSGVTEGGSSGSGLFTVDSAGSYQLRGGLLGGGSYCSAPKSPDYYSNFADVYPGLTGYFNP